MGIDAAKEFLASLTTDESLAQKADDAYVAALHGVAQEAGLAFTQDDLRGALDAGLGDLSEEELENVVGGSSLSFGSNSLTAFGGLQATATVGGVMDTVYGGTTSVANTLTQFRSFSTKGWTR